MLLAELEVWHTRPAVPTRRVALGHLVLPVDPAPGFGGLLLGAVVAAHLPDVDDDLVPDVHRLIDQVERGERIVQPRLRHRFQVDRHGLAVSRHRLVGRGRRHQLRLRTRSAAGLAQVLGAVYAVERLAPEYRRQIGPLLHKAMRWRGPIGPALIAHLAGSQTPRSTALADPAGVGAGACSASPGARRRPKREVTPSSGSGCATSTPTTAATSIDAAKAIERPRRGPPRSCPRSRD